jgi:hypothetical protein
VHAVQRIGRSARTPLQLPYPLLAEGIGVALVIVTIIAERQADPGHHGDEGRGGRVRGLDRGDRSVLGRIFGDGGYIDR